MVPLSQDSSGHADGRIGRGGGDTSKTQSAAHSVSCPERHSEIRHTFELISVRVNTSYKLSV
jgi:hypothetical protein